MTFDLRVYALIDPEHTGGHDLSSLAESIAKGGATLVQLRDKVGTTRQMIERARELLAVCLPRKIPLIVNDRVDVALAAEADGVHVGQDDMPVEEARLLLGKRAIIGLSLKSVAQAKAAPLDQLSYVGIGGVFATSSKDNREPPVGVEGFREIAAAVRARVPRFPICAIAGIDESNAGQVVSAGADGVAVISALSKAADPAQATVSLRRVVDVALSARGKP